MKIDYEKTKTSGDFIEYQRMTDAEQFGKYSMDEFVRVNDGVISGICDQSRDFISVAHKQENIIKIDQIAKASEHIFDGIAPTQGNEEKYLMLLWTSRIWIMLQMRFRE